MRITESRLRRIIRRVIIESSESGIREEVIDEIVNLAINGEVPGNSDYEGIALKQSDLNSSTSLNSFVAIYCISRGIKISSNEVFEIADRVKSKIQKKAVRNVIEMGDELATRYFNKGR